MKRLLFIATAIAVLFFSCEPQEISVTGVSLNKTTLTLTEGNSEALTATVAPSNATNKTVSWTSNNESVATVGNDGTITALTAGNATITVTTEDGAKTATCTITVESDDVLVTGVTLNKNSLTMAIDVEETLVASVEPSNATNQNVTWSSSDESVATVDGTGKISSLALGSTTITVTTEDGAKTATCTVTVSETVPVDGISFEEPTFYLVDGLDETLTVIFSPSYSTNKNVSWSSSNESVATIDESGNVTSVALGTTTITATSEDGDKTATCDVTVERLTVNVATAGTLGRLIPSENVPKIRQMVVTGTLNSSDYNNLIKYMTSLFYLDLSGLSNNTMPEKAFEENNSLQTVILPSNLESIPPYLFRWSKITSIVIPSTVTMIGEKAFWANTELTGNLIIPDAVVSINDQAFWGCSSLNGTLTFGTGLSTIGYGAFYECSGFNGNLIIPNSVLSIGDYAFYNCFSFDGNLTIGNGVTSIGEFAFYKCSGLKGELIIGSSVLSIGRAAFAECSGFTGNLTIPEAVEIIGISAFGSCKGFTENLTIGNGVTSIANSAFQFCDGFTGNLIIGNSVTSVGESAFLECTGFTGDLTIPNSVTSIKSFAFCRCTGFNEI